MKEIEQTNVARESKSETEIKHNAESTPKVKLSSGLFSSENDVLAFLKSHKFVNDDH